jgi:hypothetical protein
VVLIRPRSWERYGLQPWIEAAKRRLHHNVLAIALANKLARIAWAVLRPRRQLHLHPNPRERGTVLATVKAWPGNADVMESLEHFSIRLGVA